MLTELFALVSVEYLTFMACAQALIWLIVDPPTPSLDPYIPRAKRPPSYIGPFLSKLNSAIDAFVDHIVPLMPGSRHHPARRFRHPAQRCLRDTPSSTRNNVTMHWIRDRVRVTLSALLWSANYLFCT